MKKLYTILTLIITLITFAQAPQGFNYQATVRNSTGALIVNQNVFFKFNLMLNSVSSLPVFSETHMTPTDDLGQVNLVIGTGTATTGTFSSINWGSGNYYLGIELNTGSGYVAMGTTQLLSVPYALYANSSGNAQTPTPNLASVLAVNNGANNLKITNLAEPTTAQDAATKNYVDNASTGNTILADGSIFIGNASNTATAVALSGDVTISNTGVATISDNAVSTSNITDANITNSKLDKANIPLSGFGAATADVNLGTKKITNLANPTEIQDAATKQYVDSKIPNGTNIGDNLTWNGTNWVVSSANTTAQLPQLTTTTATGITPFAATSGGTITGDGGFSIISKGVAWSTSPNPTINDNFTNNGSGATSFQSILTNLLPGTSYYYRAYATNTMGTGYGMSFSLTTPGLATVTTTEIMQINSNSATSGGNITSDGGANITARGVCWSTSPNPSVDLVTKTVDGSGNGIFTSNLTGLTAGTTYYVKSYATNAAGTAYGNEWSFDTAAVLPTITTTEITLITSTSANSGGTITNNGGGIITASGIVWGTTTNPTLTTNIGITTDGTLIGTFISNLTGLIPGTTYYVRSYATNSAGTGYGNQITFSALPVLATLTTTEISQLLFNSAVSGGNITSSGGTAITARGVCWSTSPSPTVDLTTKTINGSGSGIFSSSITQLNPATTYYVRAYATNSVGTSYGDQISFVSQNTNNPFEITIGNQIWSTKNLDVTTYTDGTPIPQVTDPTEWQNLTTGAWCYYANNAANGTTYGKLYNWYAVAGIHDNDPSTPNKILAPTGWHMPTDAEWTTLTTFLGGESVAGGKMKSTGTIQAGTGLWQNPNTATTNESGLTVLPGGFRDDLGGSTGSIGYVSYLWSSSEDNTSNAWTRSLRTFSSGVLRSFIYKYSACSVRLVKN
jgi:uncharacterized protein (TIGR02145 family)